jgi:excisionase family DNA binding protein
MTTAAISRRLTVADVAELYGCDANKVLRWIASGELRAIDVSERRGRKPRWRIDVDDLRAFESRRASTAGDSPKAPRRKRPARPPDFIEYV